MSRRSGALFLVPLLGIATFAVLSFRDGSWGQWPWVVDLLTGTTVLTGPTTAACAAQLVVEQSRLRELTDTTVRGWLVPYRCAAQAFGWGFLTYGATAAVLLVALLSGPHGGPPDLWASWIGVAVLAVCALVGALAAVLSPYRLMVVLVGPAIFLVGAFGRGRYTDILRHGPSTGSLAGLEVAPAFWAAQVAALVAVAAALAVGIRARQAPGPATYAVLVASVVLVLVSGAAIGRTDQMRWRPSAERPTACTSTAPAICVAPSNRRDLAATARPMERAAAVLKAAGVALPARYEELLPGYRPPLTSGFIDVGALPDPVQSGAYNITAVAPCPEWFGDGKPPPDRVGEARQVLQQWVIHRSGKHVTMWSRSAQEWMDDSDSPAALAWVRATFAQLRACDLTDVRLPYADETS